MRACLFLGLVVGLLPGTAAGTPRGDGGKEAERIAQLIKQLGSDDFAKREAASEELEGIGEPALVALRKTATSTGDPEIRRRAEQVIEAIASRAGKKELATWEGTWEGEGGVWMKFAGDTWSSGTPTFGPVGGKILVVELRGKLTLADLVVLEGPTKGHRVQAIFRRDGDRLDYCGSYGAKRPTEFQTVGENYHAAMKRAKK
jgi:hypothetical protein